MGPDPRLPARLPSQSFHPLVIRRQAPGRMLRPQHVHLARQRPVRRSGPPQLVGQNQNLGRRIHHRASNETLHHLPHHLARRLLRCLPIRPQRLGGTHAFRRPRILHRLVE